MATTVGNTTEQEEYDDYTTYNDYKAGVVVWQVIPPILITFGTVGNILSIIVLTRKAIRTSTTAVYLTVLACSDLVVLYTGLLRQWLLYLFDTDVRHVSEFSCKVHMWLVYVSLDFSAWILMAVTLERVISAWLPHRAKTTCTKKSALVLMAAILTFLLVLNSHILYGMHDELKNGVVDKCSEIDQNYKDFFNLAWPWVDLCVFCILPFGVLLIGNICICVKVFASQRKTRIAPQHSGVRSQRTSQQKLAAHKKSSMTAMLFTLNVVFLVSTTPISIYNIGYPHWLDGTPGTQANLDLWWAVVNMLMYVNNSMNFMLYCLSGSRFRAEVKKMFCRSNMEREGVARQHTAAYSRTRFEPEHRDSKLTLTVNGNQLPISGATSEMHISSVA